jgi:hypothetical protein
MFSILGFMFSIRFRSGAKERPRCCGPVFSCFPSAVRRFLILYRYRQRRLERIVVVEELRPIGHGLPWVRTFLFVPRPNCPDRAADIAVAHFGSFRRAELTNVQLLLSLAPQNRWAMRSIALVLAASASETARIAINRLSLITSGWLAKLQLLITARPNVTIVSAY